MKIKLFLINALALMSFFVLSGNAGAIANPASVACMERGYVLEIRTNSENGGQYGVCKSPNGEECGEWAFFRGECTLDGQTYSRYSNQIFSNYSVIVLVSLVSIGVLYFALRKFKSTRDRQ